MSKNTGYNSYDITVELKGESGEIVSVQEVVRAPSYEDALVLAEIKAMERVYGTASAMKLNKVSKMGRITFDMNDKDFRVRQQNRGFLYRTGNALGITQIFSAGNQAKNTMVTDFQMMTAPFHDLLYDRRKNKQRMKANIYNLSSGRDRSFPEEEKPLFGGLAYSTKSHIVAGAFINNIATVFLMVCSLIVLKYSDLIVPGLVLMVLAIPAGIMGFLYVLFWVTGCYIGGKADVTQSESLRPDDPDEAPEVDPQHFQETAR